MGSKVEKVLHMLGEITYKLMTAHTETFVDKNNGKAQFYN